MVAEPQKKKRRKTHGGVRYLYYIGVHTTVNSLATEEERRKKMEISKPSASCLEGKWHVGD